MIKKIDNLNKLQSKKYSSQFSFNVGNITIPFIKESDPLSNVLNEFIYRIKNKVSNKSSKSETIRVIETLENIESKNYLIMFVPFNDLSRIHKPLLNKSLKNLEKTVLKNDLILSEDIGVV